MECKETLELLPAHVDRELGLPESMEIERHLKTCPPCRAEYAEQLALRAAIRKDVTYFNVPGHLESRIEAALPSAPAHRLLPAKRDWNWSAMGAALVSIVAVAWSISLYLALPSAEDRLADEVVSSHVRSLLTSHGVDVASSDRHTVKPWFNGKLSFSPPVYDLTTEGFPLVGGRLDYLDHRPVAALVYRHRQHIIDLFVAPATGNKNDTVPGSLSIQGYHLVRWAHGGMVFWAVSDVEPAQLGKFRETLLTHMTGS
ncbi:MAG: anti-sigma factor [Gammaproteobacteria bacterium]|nr:anti-sigma factor [Gammaproteobacteria bacterium]